jgi:GR25 family glycosyltransferase involved in LPS biosynthesis
MGYDICTVINLDTKPHRMEATIKELTKIGVKKILRFSAITGGEAGCARSHYECLKMQESPLLIFEDDVVFEPEALKTISKAMEQLPDDFDLFYFGANVKSPAIKYSENLFKITGGVHCTHAMFWSAKGRKRILELWNPYSEQEFHQIDHWLYMKGQGAMECYVCYPLMAFQRADHSDIRGAWFDYRDEMLENQKNNMK